MRDQGRGRSLRFREKLLRNERILKATTERSSRLSIPLAIPGLSPIESDAAGRARGSRTPILGRKPGSQTPDRPVRRSPIPPFKRKPRRGDWLRFDPLRPGMRFSRRLLTIALQGARGSRDGRAKVDPRQDSRQGAQARGRGHATTGANRPPSSLPDPTQCSPPPDPR